MNVCLVAPNDALSDPRARVMRHLLREAGHEVHLVLPREGPELPGVTRARIPRARSSQLRRVLRSKPGRAARAKALTNALSRAAEGIPTDVYVPTDARALDAAVHAARATGAAVSRAPNMGHAGDVDLIDLAPSHPDRAAPVAGWGRLHTPGDDRSPYHPEPGRFEGRKVVLCYRRSEINPGRYLEEGLRRSGVSLRVETTGIDLGSVDPSTDFVVFVEGPYPALGVTGSTDVPTLFWFHHGEHHLHANLRLADRYRADAVLMAHSWHLAFWSRAPVHRFPFGVATELLDPSRRHADRSYDVAMVGAKLRSGGPYGRRQQLVAELEVAFPAERLGFREAVSAEEMALLYGDSRIVINEGGTRHFPITMRVLEAVGSGAVLLSDPLPGMEMLLEEGSQYALLGPDVTADVKQLLGDPDRLQTMADTALQRAMGLHTYDHRVDELFQIAAGTPKRPVPARGEMSPLAAVIDHDVEVQRVAHLDAPELVDQLPDREVWEASTLGWDRLQPGKMEAIALRGGSIAGNEDLLLAARRYVYLEGDAAGLQAFLDRHAPRARVERIGGVTRVDLMAPSYRIMPFELGQA